MFDLDTFFLSDNHRMIISCFLITPNLQKGIQISTKALLQNNQIKEQKTEEHQNHTQTPWGWIKYSEKKVKGYEYCSSVNYKKSEYLSLGKYK